MLLTVDIGNTNTVLGAFDGDNLRFTSRISTVHNATADETAVTLRGILRLYHVEGADFKGSIISSVVPAATLIMAPALKLITGREPLVVGPGIKTGLNIRIDNPAQLGADMAVDSVAAMAKYGKPVIVCDLGTATTITAVNEKGEFIGGAIHPGVRVSIEALSQRAAQLPHIAIEAPKTVIGKNTIDCMRSAAVFGTAAMIDGMVERMEDEMSTKCTVVVTGGLAGEVSKHTKRDVIFDPQLLLDGLRIIYEKNTQ